MSGSPPPTMSGTNHASIPTTPPISAAQFHGALAEAVGYRDGPQKRAVVSDGREPGDTSKDKEERVCFRAGVNQFFEKKLRPVPEEQSSDRDGGCRRTQRRDGDARLESAYQFLQNENGSRDGRVKGGGQPSASTSRHERPAVRPVAAEDRSNQMGKTRPHLHAGSLPPKRQAGTNGQNASHKFHRDEQKRRWRQFLIEHGLNVRNPAPRRERGEAVNQPGRHTRGNGTRHDHEAKAYQAVSVRPGDRGVPQAVRPIKGEAEEGSDQSRSRADEEREETKDEETPRAIGGRVRVLLFGFHRLCFRTSMSKKTRFAAFRGNARGLRGPSPRAFPRNAAKREGVSFVTALSISADVTRSEQDLPPLLA